MKQIALSIEKMKHLKELGLDISDASMFWNYKGEDYDKQYYNLDVLDFDYDMLTLDDMPTYTLENILNKLPSYIDNTTLNISFQLTISKGINNYYYIEYSSINSIYDKTLVSFQHKNILIAAFYTLKWCIENNYIKTNK